MQSSKSFRITNVIFVAFMVAASYASVDVLGDEADWTDRLVSLSSAVTPWLLALMILWATSQIVDAIRSDVGARDT